MCGVWGSQQCCSVTCIHTHEKRGASPCCCPGNAALAAAQACRAELLSSQQYPGSQGSHTGWGKGGLTSELLWGERSRPMARYPAWEAWLKAQLQPVPEGCSRRAQTPGACTLGACTQPQACGSGTPPPSPPGQLWDAWGPATGMAAGQLWPRRSVRTCCPLVASPVDGSRAGNGPPLALLQSPHDPSAGTSWASALREPHARE